MSEVRDRVRCVSDRKHARSARPPVLVSGCEAGLIDIAQRRGQPRRGPETRRDPRRITRNLRTAFGRHSHELLVLNILEENSLDADELSRVRQLLEGGKEE